jgi:hypothetical protein
MNEPTEPNVVTVPIPKEVNKNDPDWVVMQQTIEDLKAREAAMRQGIQNAQKCLDEILGPKKEKK